MLISLFHLNIFIFIFISLPPFILELQYIFTSLFYLITFYHLQTPLDCSLYTTLSWIIFHTFSAHSLSGFFNLTSFLHFLILERSLCTLRPWEAKFWQSLLTYFLLWFLFDIYIYTMQFLSLFRWRTRRYAVTTYHTDMYLLTFSCQNNFSLH